MNHIGTPAVSPRYPITPRKPTETVTYDKRKTYSNLIQFCLDDRLDRDKDQDLVINLVKSLMPDSTGKPATIESISHIVGQLTGNDIGFKCTAPELAYFVRHDTSLYQLFSYESDAISDNLTSFLDQLKERYPLIYLKAVENQFVNLQKAGMEHANVIKCLTLENGLNISGWDLRSVKIGDGCTLEHITFDDKTILHFDIFNNDSNPFNIANNIHQILYKIDGANSCFISDLESNVFSGEGLSDGVYQTCDNHHFQIIQGVPQVLILNNDVQEGNVPIGRLFDKKVKNGVQVSNSTLNRLFNDYTRIEIIDDGTLRRKYIEFLMVSASRKVICSTGLGYKSFEIRFKQALNDCGLPKDIVQASQVTTEVKEVPANLTPRRMTIHQSL